MTVCSTANVGSSILIAHFNLRVCYENGFGVEKNEVEAVKWYTQSAVQGNATAQIAVALNCEMQQNYDQAFHHYLQALHCSDDKIGAILDFFEIFGSNETMELMFWDLGQLSTEALTTLQQFTTTFWTTATLTKLKRRGRGLHK